MAGSLFGFLLPCACSSRPCKNATRLPIPPCPFGRGFVCSAFFLGNKRVPTDLDTMSSTNFKYYIQTRIYQVSFLIFSKQRDADAFFYFFIFFLHFKFL